MPAMIEVLQAYSQSNKNNQDDHEVNKHDAFNYEDKKEKINFEFNSDLQGAISLVNHI